MSKTKPKRQTRYQVTKALIDEGQCGLLPVDAAVPCPCPKQGGPEQPHPDYPGKVWRLTCQGCKYFHDLFLDNHVCTHPQARQVAAQWLTEAIARWERRQPEWFASALAKLGTVTEPNELAEIYRRARALQMPGSVPLVERSWLASIWPAPVMTLLDADQDPVEVDVSPVSGQANVYRAAYRLTPVEAERDPDAPQDDSFDQAVAMARQLPWGWIKKIVHVRVLADGAVDDRQVGWTPRPWVQGMDCDGHNKENALLVAKRLVERQLGTGIRTLYNQAYVGKEGYSAENVQALESLVWETLIPDRGQINPALVLYDLREINCNNLADVVEDALLNAGVECAPSGAGPSWLLMQGDAQPREQQREIVERAWQIACKTPVLDLTPHRSIVTICLTTGKRVTGLYVGQEQGSCCVKGTDGRCYDGEIVVDSSTGKEPWQMTPAEWLALEHTMTRSGSDMHYHRFGGGRHRRVLWPGTTSKKKVIRDQHQFEVQDALMQGKPVPARVLAEYPDLASTVPEGSQLNQASESGRERSESKDAFDYVPADIRAKIPRLYKTEKLSHEEAIVWLKFFTPDSSWSWYVTEFDGEDILFGLVVGHEVEAGYVSLAEIRDVQDPWGLHVERDVWWNPKPLCQVPEYAQWSAADRTLVDKYHGKKAVAGTIEVDGVTFQRFVGNDQPVYYYESLVGWMWSVSRVQPDEYAPDAAPYWTAQVVGGEPGVDGAFPDKLLTDHWTTPEGIEEWGPLAGEVDAGDVDPPMQLLQGVARLINQGYNPWANPPTARVVQTGSNRLDEMLARVAKQRPPVQVEGDEAEQAQYAAGQRAKSKESPAVVLTLKASAPEGTGVKMANRGWWWNGDRQAWQHYDPDEGWKMPWYLGLGNDDLSGVYDVVPSSIENEDPPLPRGCSPEIVEWAQQARRAPGGAELAGMRWMLYQSGRALWNVTYEAVMSGPVYRVVCTGYNPADSTATWKVCHWPDKDSSKESTGRLLMLDVEEDRVVPWRILEAVSDLIQNGGCPTDVEPNGVEIKSDEPEIKSAPAKINSDEPEIKSTPAEIKSEADKINSDKPEADGWKVLTSLKWKKGRPVAPGGIIEVYNGDVHQLTPWGDSLWCMTCSSKECGGAAAVMAVKPAKKKRQASNA